MSEYQIGMSQQQLDEIELRLAGADHRPWLLDRSVQDERGRPCVCKGSRKSHKKLAKSLQNAAHATVGNGIDDLTKDLLPQNRKGLEEMAAKLDALLVECESASSPDVVAQIKEMHEKVRRGLERASEQERDVASLAARHQNAVAVQKQSLALFRLCDEATEDMGDFVAHAPDDIDALLQEVKMLRKRYRDCEQDRDSMKKELLSLRVEKSTLQDKLNDQRRAWRAFRDSMGDGK